MDNQEEFLLVRFLRHNKKYRIISIIIILIIGLVSSWFSINYLWFDITPSVWSWGTNPVVWWKAILAFFGCMYIILGGVFPLMLFIIIYNILALYIEDKESHYYQKFLDTRQIKNSKNIFIIHGRDEGPKETVSRFIEKLNLNAIILHEQINKGKTIIEKFEDHASQAGFAIALLTPDDFGKVKHKNDLRPRARQNVILELGYFSGLLGREKVFVLIKDDVEIPTDFLGIVYTKFDANGGWKLTLIKEMKNANIFIDEEQISQLLLG